MALFFATTNGHSELVALLTAPRTPVETTSTAVRKLDLFHLFYLY